MQIGVKGIIWRVKDDIGYPLDIIYVVHCFQKKTPKTRKADIDLAEKRYRALVKELVQ